MSTALDDIAAERRRQVEAEGWTPEHDDAHSDGSMALAAACYAMFASVSDDAREATTMPASLTTTGADIPGWSAWLEIWPWDRKWWKPKDRRRDLIRAGALIIAEIERLDRADAGRAALEQGGAVMSAWNGVYEPSSTDGDACCACNSPAEPAKYVAGVGLMCLECFQAEFEPDDDGDDLVEEIRAVHRGERCFDCGEPIRRGDPCPACAEKRELLRQTFPKLHGDA